MQLAAIIVSLVITVVAVALFGRAIAEIYRFVKLGQPVPAGTRTGDPTQRTLTLAKEFLGHTRMNRWGIVGFAHWFVAVGFFSLLLTIVNAFGQLFQADWLIPIIGDWLPYEIFTEFLGLMTVLGILTLIVIRQLNRPAPSARGRIPARRRRTQRLRAPAETAAPDARRSPPGESRRLEHIANAPRDPASR